MRKPTNKKANSKSRAKKKDDKKIIITAVHSESVQNDMMEEESDEKMSDEEIAADENAKLMRLLSKPEETLGITDNFKEGKEVVTICPVCRMEGVFIDNICPNCGSKKKPKSTMQRYDLDEDVFAKNDDYYVNEDE
jgi:hypothetical protein